MDSAVSIERELAAELEVRFHNGNVEPDGCLAVLRKNHGARVSPGPGEILLDPTTVQLHGEIHIDCYPSGLDIGYWNNWQDWAGWKTPLIPAGDYDVIARTAEPDAPTEFIVKVGDQAFTGSTEHTRSWDDYRDISVGVLHVDQTDETIVEFRPRGPEHWRPTNLAAIRLVPHRSEK